MIRKISIEEHNIRMSEILIDILEVYGGYGLIGIKCELRICWSDVAWINIGEIIGRYFKRNRLYRLWIIVISGICKNRNQKCFADIRIGKSRDRSIDCRVFNNAVLIG